MKNHKVNENKILKRQNVQKSKHYEWLSLNFLIFFTKTLN